MAINYTVLKSVVVWGVLLFLIGNASAGSGQFVWSGEDNDTVTLGSGGSTVGTRYINTLHINNAQTLQNINFFSWTVPDTYYEGPAASSTYQEVTLWIGATQVGNAYYGHTRNAAAGTVTVYIVPYNLSLDLYTGAQDVTFSNTLNIRVRNVAASGTADKAVALMPQVNDNQAYFLLSDGRAAFIDSAGDTHKFYTQSSYYFVNQYEYSNIENILYFNLSRDTGSKLQMVITSPFKDIVNETSLQSTDFDTIDWDYTNNTWWVNVTNLYGETENHSITFVYEETPQTEDTILWGADSYVVDDIGSYSWSASDDTWDTIFYTIVASIYRDETLVHEVSLPTQTGTLYYTFEDEGNYEVKLRKRSFLLPHVTVYTDTVTVLPIGESFITSTNSTIYINTPIGFQYSFGFTPEDAFLTGIEAKKLTNGVWTAVKFWSLSDELPLTAQTLYNYTLVTSGHHPDSPLTTEGDYIFYLLDSDRGTVAMSDVYTVEYKPGTPTQTVTSTYLNISTGETYIIGEEIRFNYGIDNTNFSNGTNYIEVYNYDFETTTQSVLLSKQVDYKWGYINPVGSVDETESYYWNPSILVALPGDNKILLRHDNVNGTTEMVFDNFTLSEINNQGYGLKLSKYEACVNEGVTMAVTIPTAANLTIYTPSNVIAKTYFLNESTTLIYYFPVSGQYVIELTPSGSNAVENVANIYIDTCQDTSIIDPGTGDMGDMYKNIFNFMTIPAFWGIIIWISVIGGMAIKRDRFGNPSVSSNGIIFIALTLSTLLAIAGLFAPYTMYIIVSTWIFAGISFKIGQSMAKGE